MKAQAKTTAETKAETTAPVKVPAALSASIATLVSAEATIKIAVGGREKALVQIGETVAKLFKSKEEASPVLKQAFENAKLTGPNASSQRSRILGQAFPVNPAALAAAKAGPIRFKNGKGDIVEKEANTLQLNAIAAGSLAPVKQGKHTLWVPVVKAAGNQSGGHNVIKPLEAAKKAVETAATAFCGASKGSANAFFVMVVEVLSSIPSWKFDKEEAATILED